jgi:hypothetical protein
MHMTPPPPPGYGPPPAAPSNDKTTLWGVLGIVFSLCCVPLGIVFAVLSHMEANKAGKSPTLAIVAYCVAALGVVLNIVYWINR